MRYIQALVTSAIMTIIMFFLSRIDFLEKQPSIFLTLLFLVIFGVAIIALMLFSKLRNPIKLYREEAESIPDFKRDLSNKKLQIKEIILCGSGVTMGVFVLLDLLEALNKGIKVNVFVLDPESIKDQKIALEFNKREPNLFEDVIAPICSALDDDGLRPILDDTFCQEIIQKLMELKTKGNDFHKHSVLINCICEIWKKFQNRISDSYKNNLKVYAFPDPGEVTKMWRILIESANYGDHSRKDTDKIFYLGIQVHGGVSIKNPLIRFRVAGNNIHFGIAKTLEDHLANIRASILRQII